MDKQLEKIAEQIAKEILNAKAGKADGSKIFQYSHDFFQELGLNRDASSDKEYDHSQPYKDVKKLVKVKLRSELKNPSVDAIKKRWSRVVTTYRSNSAGTQSTKDEIAKEDKASRDSATAELNSKKAALLNQLAEHRDAIKNILKIFDDAAKLK